MSSLVVGCGYLGMRVAQGWLAEGRRVFATTRSPRRGEEFARAGIEPVVCDVLDPDSLGALPAAETVVYCVGLDRAAGVPMRRVYVEGLANVLAVLKGDPRTVYVSSTSVYGQSEGELIDENAATEPQEESGRVVLAAEGVLREARPAAVILRFAGIYGPGRLPRSRDLLAGNSLPTDPEKWLNLIHVEDGTRAVLAACERGSPGRVYNVCDGRPVRRREFYERLAEVLGAPPPRFVSPAAPSAGESANRRIGNERMLRELGVVLEYPSFREGLVGP